MNYQWNILNKSQSLKEIGNCIREWKNIPEGGMAEFINVNNIIRHDPFLLTNMDKTVKRLKQSIANEEKICIIGDYDCDGITATSTLYIGLRSIFSNVIWMVPDRFKDGYGLNVRLVDAAYTEGCQLIITVDNGIAAKSAIDYAKSLGMDIIVTDHHKVPADGIPTEITVDPHQNDSYPFKSICGCMVAFKVIQALIPDMQINNKDLYEELVAITAIGTITDVMDLVSENRYYVKNGLQYLSCTKNIGLRTLLEKLDMYGKNLNSGDIGWTIGPCINAVGRLESPDIAVKLLLSDDPVEANKIADKIISLNEKRKDLEKKALDSLVVNEDEKFIVATMDGIGHGLLGLIAGKVVDKYKRPCFILGGNEEKGTLSGSGRSIYTYNMFDIIEKNRDIIKGGGHEAACGVEIKYNDLEEFKKRCTEHYNKWSEQATKDDLTPKINIVSEITIDLIDDKLINNIDKLKPFGNGNEEPIFASKELRVVNSKVVGRNENVIQFEFSDGFCFRKAVGFKNIKEKYEELGKPEYVNVAYTVAFNTWNGRTTPQMIITDIEENA